MQSGLERGFRYFKVSPIKAFRDIRHVHRNYFLQLIELRLPSQIRKRRVTWVLEGSLSCGCHHQVDPRDRGGGACIYGIAPEGERIVVEEHCKERREPITHGFSDLSCGK
jgi:hypothetical protein